MATGFDSTNIRDNAQSLAEAIRPLLNVENNFEISLSESTIWLKDIHGSGYVAWAERDNIFGAKYTQTVLPELRQLGSFADALPTIDELEAFISTCSHLANLPNE